MLTLTSTEIEDLHAFRRDLHMHPELGYEEHRTAALVEARLQRAGLKIYRGFAETGLVAVLDGELPGKTFGYRADMDALPIEEQNKVSYCSRHPGKMHACGHDLHTAIGVGVAELLAKNKARLHGRFVFYFQPNEEGAPGAGLSGADAMIRDGVLEKHPIEGLLAIHCMPSLDVGKIGYCPRAVWAGSDLLQIRVRGVQTHAAYPHLGIDPIVASAHLIAALQTVSSRTINPLRACVLSFGQIHAGEQFNVIPEEVFLEGILRTFDDEVRDRAIAALARIIEHTPQAFGAKAEWSLHQGALPVINDEGLLKTVLGIFNARDPEVITEIDPQMGAEDFSAFSRVLPSVYLLLGVRDEDSDCVHPLHSPHFNAHEDAIRVGVENMAQTLAVLTKDPEGRR